MTAPIDKYADTLYSLDIIERIDELRGIPSDELTELEQDELTALLKLQDELSTCSEWIYGDLLISNTYFTTYVKELAHDLYTIPDHWPFWCIDWNKAADDIKYDFIDVEYMGLTFWIRG